VVKIVNSKHILPKNIEITQTCKSLINKLLEKDPSKRIEIYDSAYEEWYADDK
jgi:serine/threonine protein kinase